MRSIVLPAALVAAAALIAPSALAHVVAGPRVFPVTLTFDDPGVGDEASVPALVYSRAGANGGSGPGHEVDLGLEFDKTITSDTALIFNTGFDIQQLTGAKTHTGWQNLVVTGKWQAYTDPAHELVVSLGIQREIGGTGTIHAGADHYGATTPTLYVGKGMGDLPVPGLRPFAISGELSYTIADKGLKATEVTDPQSGLISSQFNTGNNNAWNGGLSLQYSVPYLQSQVQNIGLGHLLGNIVPVLELTWSSPASSPSGQGTTWVAAPGAIYMARWGEIGIEALVPLNTAAGTNVGAVALVHLFFDDLFPNSIGRPLMPRL